MARKRKPKPDDDMLIDVLPENSKAIISAARSYQKYQQERIAALEREIEYKQKILELVKAAKLKPLEGGVIKFSVDGIEITIKPRDELVRVKDKSGETNS